MGIPKVNEQQTNQKLAKGAVLTENHKKIIGFAVAIILFMVMYFGLPATFDHSARIMVAIVSTAIALWALEPIPLGLTAVIVLLLMMIFNVATTDVVFSGFASPAVFLIIGGMMLARAVNETPLAKRVTYYILSRWGGSANGLLGSFLIIPQIQAFFIPATAVRTALLLPVVQNVLDMIGAKPESKLNKMILLGVSYGGTISGTAVMTAAIGNILTVELLNSFLDLKITYFQWFLYALPIWILLIPLLYLLLIKIFPMKEEEALFPHVKEEMSERVKEFGPMSMAEKRCLFVLILTVLLWVLEPLHGFHPSVPALIGVALMTLPGIGCSSWSTVVKINYDTVLLIGATLSVGYSLNESGATELLGESLSTPWVISLMEKPIVSIIFILIITHLFHLAISNVATAVVTLIPIFIGLSVEAGADPLLICFTASIACLHGYILVVETMPNVLVHSTGRILQRNFLMPGIYMTLIMILVTVVVALTWWRWIGLY
ncbi:DASS family sodium-coupled anion symporter [Salinibacillus xinjiangensis]|uniref:Sodium-dependent dicarboxylate transporter SdcS n=1 Tax=Salinibacillus xinjiangensis TaxID=1229268 RepID=A0A6G1X1F3_9BACI|nr:DASS family sodium-coupled anion symporter [Salinibacillus xinjiangensis]